MTTAAVKKNISKLTQDKVYKLHKWLEDWPLSTTDNYKSLSIIASKQFDFAVTPANMRGALAAMGKELPKPVPAEPPAESTVNAALQIQLQTVAAELASLMQELGRSVSPPLSRIAKPQQALI